METSKAFNRLKKPTHAFVKDKTNEEQSRLFLVSFMKKDTFRFMYDIRVKWYSWNPPSFSDKTLKFLPLSQW